MDKKTKSPLKDRPLRYVAQSTDEALDDLLTDKILPHYLGACGVLVATLYEWMRFYNPPQGPPKLLSVIYGTFFVVCAYNIFRHWRKVKALKQGRDGERAVGQYLELFRESGCHIYHDILGKGFNVDHVVISPKGIFVCETKTYSKPVSGKANINFDGQKILIYGQEPLTDIITQANAADSYIKGILKDSTGKDFDTFPVVLFPGWYVEGEGNRQGKMWVLEPKAFRKFLDAEQVKLSFEDVKLASYHLSRHIRVSWQSAVNRQ